MLRSDKRSVRNTMLEKIKRSIDDSLNSDDLEQKVSMEGYCVDVDIVTDALENLVNDDGTSLTSEQKEEMMEILKNDKCFRFEGDKVEVVRVPLDFKLKEKFNIVIDDIKDNITEIAIAAGGIVIVGSLVVGAASVANSKADDTQRYQNSVVTVDEQQDYPMKDIYVVYNDDNVYFCNRQLQHITEDEKVYGQFVLGGGVVDEYYYRDEIYDYYDIRTGEKTCQDHEDGFYIEELMKFYEQSEMKDRDYKISLSEVSDNIDSDYLLSRDPGLKRK